MQDKHPEEQEGMLQEEENTMEWRPQDADREMVKRQIRDRVRSAKVADNAVFIPARPEPKVYDDGQKMVAAYTRVSTLSTEQVSSIENQTRFYTEKIEKKIQSVSSSQDRDEYFEAAARFIIEKDKATIGMLQRMFKIGFNRAARIIDQLAEAGIIGPEEGTKPRKVLMSAEQLDQYFEEY